LGDFQSEARGFFIFKTLPYFGQVRARKAPAREIPAEAPIQKIRLRPRRVFFIRKFAHSCRLV